MVNGWLVGGDWNMNGFFHFIKKGCHPNPIDEVHHFSRWAHCTTKQDTYQQVISLDFWWTFFLIYSNPPQKLWGAMLAMFEPRLWAKWGNLNTSGLYLQGGLSIFTGLLVLQTCSKHIFLQLELGSTLFQDVSWCFMVCFFLTWMRYNVRPPSYKLVYKPQ